jgi:hypothetical protein
MIVDVLLHIVAHDAAGLATISFLTYLGGEVLANERPSGDLKRAQKPFTGKLRDRCLNLEWFRSRPEVLSRAWRPWSSSSNILTSIERPSGITGSRKQGRVKRSAFAPDQEEVSIGEGRSGTAYLR